MMDLNTASRVIGRDACPQASATTRSAYGRLRAGVPTICFIRLASLLVVLLLPLTASAVRLIDAGAIPFTAFLSKADFDQRYPGKKVTDLSTLEPGWYVIYEHESLSYYFGPVLLESTGQDYLAQLTETVEGAVAQRPTIQDYRLELSYEPSQSSTPSGSSGSGSSSGDPSGGYGAPQPAPPSGFWGFIRSIFGF